MIKINQEEKRKLFAELWPSIVSEIDRSKFENRKKYKAKVGWARRRLWKKIIKELVAKNEDTTSI